MVEGAVIDLRHMLYVGRKGPFAGNSVEILQKLDGQSSGGNFQDAYSNFLGYQFYHFYGEKIKNNPNMFVNYLTDFLTSSNYGRLQPNMEIKYYKRK